MSRETVPRIYSGHLYFRIQNKSLALERIGKIPDINEISSHIKGQDNFNPNLSFFSGQGPRMENSFRGPIHKVHRKEVPTKEIH